MDDFLQQCRAVIGSQYVLIDEADRKPYETEWRQRYRGHCLAVLRPASTTEVADLVKLCRQFKISIVPQGGNSGLVIGSVPDSSGSSVVLSLRRLNKIRAIDTDNNTITVDAGCILNDVQQSADNSQRLFPLSLASEGTCTVGGNLSSNAGGTAVLRYGNARELCLGLEVVNAQGEIWDGLKGLRKDNTGYDLRDLFIGAEGSLGIITAAVMKLYPKPKAIQTALVALSSPEAALELLNLSREGFGPALTGFEFISAICLELVHKHFSDIPLPFSEAYSYYVLLEISDHESESHARQLAENVLGQALEGAIISNAVIADSMTQANNLWKIRENISMAQAAEGKNIKHDISLPSSCIPAFMMMTAQLIVSHFPGCRLICFGHMGDGNLHYNISPPIGVNDQNFISNQEAINRLVHDQVHAYNGSISAEHGIGSLKRKELLRYKSAVELQMMRAIKSALDPDNIMNPGKIL
ncbi:FAD-binding oxidoreductase [Undibacterium jejuense]|uniref:FAD-binding oxidoreductase n=1 Tax=Undibacterium jejuense TaxID=1344949 RepID=A0A923HMH5_9BURK|nr:FAD-binding oxidoreductase [Undibacterium jejuense]MBC3862326.1 FAD-binding oxidoreductase [Undibacterium jejuense]